MGSLAAAQRTQEIGIRAALGANAGTLVGLVMRQAIVLAVIGIGGSLAVGNLLASLLFGVTPSDAVTFLIAPLTLGLTALLAAWIPARRAAAIDPIRALRVE